MHNLHLPCAFGKYLLTERLATGGMAEVFRATLQNVAGVDKEVALKRLRPDFSNDPEFTALLHDEARIAMTLTHANIAQTFDFGEVNGIFYLTLELVEGLDLARLMELLRGQGQPMPMATAAFVVAEAARGLAYAHERRGPDSQLAGIVHRDVSPQNILLSSAGEVKVADFGIAKAKGNRHRTATGVVMGKLRYMSPEQLAGSALDGRSDLFSLGVILYELLTGARATGASDDSFTSLADLLRTAPIPCPSQCVPSVPQDLDAIVMKALCGEVSQRYQRATDLARDLTVFVNRTAPELTREDLGALVGLMATPSRQVVEPGPALPDLWPQDPPDPPRQLDIATRTATPDGGQGLVAAPRPRRHPQKIAKETLWVAILICVICLSGGLIVLRFTLPGDAPGSEPGPALPLPPVAPDAPPAPAPARETDLIALEQAVRMHGPTRPTVITPEMAVYLTALDFRIATLILDDPERHEESPYPSELERLVTRFKVGPAVDATVQYVRATQGLPRDTKVTLSRLLAGKPALGVIATSGQGDAAIRYSLAALATWLEPSRGRLVELARANDVLQRWCPAPQPPGRHLLPEACELETLTDALHKAGEVGTASALERWRKAAPLGTATDLGQVSGARWESRSGEMVLSLEAVLEPRVAVSIVGAGVRGPIRAAAETELRFLVPRSAFALVAEVSSRGRPTRHIRIVAQDVLPPHHIN